METILTTSEASSVKWAKGSDRYGDIHVDTEKSHATYTKWLRMTRPADQVSPDGSRSPYWLLRPFKPGRNVYQLLETESIHKAHKD